MKKIDDASENQPGIGYIGLQTLILRDKIDSMHRWRSIMTVEERKTRKGDLVYVRTFQVRKY